MKSAEVLLGELIIQMKETDNQLKQTDKQQKETDNQLNKLKDVVIITNKETAERMKETDESMKETDKKIDKLQSLVGGIGNSNGYVAEQLFFNSLSRSMSLGNMRFDQVDRNLERTRGGLKDEFDIILENSNILIIVEVKYNFHHNDVKKVLKKIKNFKILSPHYKNYKIIGAIAGMAMSAKTIDEAKKYGFFVLTQEGDDIKILNDSVKEYHDDFPVS